MITIFISFSPKLFLKSLKNSLGQTTVNRSFNTGSSTTVTIAFEYTPHAEGFNPSDGNSEIRFDDVAVIFDGPTPDGEEAFVDEIRLVSFPGIGN